MTKYEMPNGTTVMIPTELLLIMSDEDLKDYLANANGFEITDPFYDSVLDNGEHFVLDNFQLPEEADDIPEGFVEDDD